MTPSNRNLHHQTKTAFVADYLRRAIIGGQRPVGTRIKEDEVAAELNLSATPVREAIRLLEAEGYLQSVAHQGARVVSPYEHSLREMFQLQRIISGYVMQLAAERITEEELDQLDEIYEGMVIASKHQNGPMARELDYAFHMAIATSTRITQIKAMTNCLWAGVPWDLLSPGRQRMEWSVKEHGQILRALRARNPGKARAALINQVTNSEREALAVLEQPTSLSGGADMPPADDRQEDPLTKQA